MIIFKGEEKIDEKPNKNIYLMGTKNVTRVAISHDTDM